MKRIKNIKKKKNKKKLSMSQLFLRYGHHHHETENYGTVMLMEENQLKEMLRFSNELEQKSWLLPHTQEELEIAINRGMEDVKAGRIVSHEDVLKYYMK